MQNKNNLNINTEERSNISINNLPTEAFSIENAPIHSMKKDLEMIKNPAVINQKSTSQTVVPSSKYVSSSKVSPFPIVSPFLEKITPSPIISVSQKKIENTKESIINSKPQQQTKSNSSEQDTFKKVFIFLIFFLSLVALSFGSYYFWFVRGENPDSVAEESVPITSTSIEDPSLSAAEVELEIKPEESKENIIVLDLENSNKLTLKENLKNQIEKLTDIPSGIPLELKLQDSKNNPILLQIFAEKTGIAFLKSISAYLKESFRFFVFKDESQLSLGLILESKNDTLLAREILKKEPLLIENLDVILLEKFEKPAKISFRNNNTHKNLPVRYYNIISPEKLTIDYAITKNKLFFGTTRNTIYALYDLILSQPDGSL